MKQRTASGVSVKTSLVRKRRWLRKIRCVSSDIMQLSQLRLNHVTKVRQCIEKALFEKEEAIIRAEKYERMRSAVMAQSLHLGTQGTLNTLSILKDLAGKLRKLRQVSKYMHYVCSSTLLLFNIYC